MTEINDLEYRKKLQEYRIRVGRDPMLVLINPEDIIMEGFGTYGIVVQYERGVKPGEIVFVDLPKEVLRNYIIQEFTFFLDYEKDRFIHESGRGKT